MGLGKLVLMDAHRNGGLFRLGQAVFGVVDLPAPAWCCLPHPPCRRWYGSGRPVAHDTQHVRQRQGNSEIDLLFLRPVGATAPPSAPPWPGSIRMSGLRGVTDTGFARSTIPTAAVRTTAQNMVTMRISSHGFEPLLSRSPVMSACRFFNATTPFIPIAREVQICHLFQRRRFFFLFL